MADLKGKVAVITGGTTGIGEACAIEFAKYQCKLVICGRNLAGLQDTKDKCIEKGLNNEDVAIVTGDICEDETLDLIVKTTIDKFSRVDVLFLSAAKGYPVYGPVTKPETVEALDYNYEIMVKSPYKLTQKLSSELIKNKGAVVINSSILADSLVEPNGTGYAIMKAAQCQMARLFALTFANKGVRVNAIKPGYSRTNLLSMQAKTSIFNPDVAFDAMAELTPIGQSLSTPEEIARVVVFLSSSQSACMTGTLLTMDKGYSMTHPAVDWKQF